MDVIITLNYLWILVLDWLGACPNWILVSFWLEAFVELLWVGMGGINIDVSLSIGIGMGADTVGINFSLFHSPLFWDYI